MVCSNYVWLCDCIHVHMELIVVTMVVLGIYSRHSYYETTRLVTGHCFTLGA